MPSVRDIRVSNFAEPVDWRQRESPLLARKREAWGAQKRA
jgi:hypothetical protein